MFLLVFPLQVIWGIKYFKKKDYSAIKKICIGATLACIISTVIWNVSIFGRMYSPLEGSVGRSFEHKFIDAYGRKIDYWVEFVNPFNDNHKERLVLHEGKKKRVIDMKLVKRKGFFTHCESNLRLEQDGSNLLLKSKLETAPHTRFVLFDYRSGIVQSNWVEEAAWSIAKRKKKAEADKANQSER